MNGWGGRAGQEGLWDPSGLMVGGLSVSSCPAHQVPQDSSPAVCHNNLMKQAMVDSSCRILTSDIFRDCNRLVRAGGE